MGVVSCPRCGKSAAFLRSVGSDGVLVCKSCKLVGSLDELEKETAFQERLLRLSGSYAVLEAVKGKGDTPFG